MAVYLLQRLFITDSMGEEVRKCCVLSQPFEAQCITICITCLNIKKESLYFVHRKYLRLCVSYDSHDCKETNKSAILSI